MQNHIREITKAIGREKLAEALGLSVHSVKRAEEARQFPASWWVVVKHMAPQATMNDFAFKKVPGAARS